MINRAPSVKGGSATLLYVYVDVEPVSFNRGFYTVDMRFFLQRDAPGVSQLPGAGDGEGLSADLTSGPSSSAARATPRSLLQDAGGGAGCR